MNRTELIRRAVLAFLEYGRGSVVILLDDAEPIYVRADEAVHLSDDMALGGLLAAEKLRALDC